MQKTEIVCTLFLFSSIGIVASEGPRSKLSRELISPRGPKQPAFGTKGGATTVLLLQEYLDDPSRDVIFIPLEDGEDAHYTDSGVGVVSWKKMNEPGAKGLMLTFQKNYVGNGPLNQETLSKALAQISDSCQRNGEEHYRTKDTRKANVETDFVVRHRKNAEGKTVLNIEMEEVTIVKQGVSRGTKASLLGIGALSGAAIVGALTVLSPKSNSVLKGIQ